MAIARLLTPLGAVVVYRLLRPRKQRLWIVLPYLFVVVLLATSELWVRMYTR